MTDIVKRLNEAIGDPNYFAPINDNGSCVEFLRECLAEIERLRRIAGAVTGGQSFSEMYRRRDSRPLYPSEQAEIKHGGE